MQMLLCQMTKKQESLREPPRPAVATWSGVTSGGAFGCPRLGAEVEFVSDSAWLSKPKLQDSGEVQTWFRSTHLQTC